MTVVQTINVVEVEATFPHVGGTWGAHQRKCALEGRVAREIAQSDVCAAVQEHLHEFRVPGGHGAVQVRVAVRVLLSKHDALVQRGPHGGGVAAQDARMQRKAVLHAMRPHVGAQLQIVPQ